MTQTRGPVPALGARSDTHSAPHGRRSSFALGATTSGPPRHGAGARALPSRSAATHGRSFGGMLTIEADWIQIAGLRFTAGARWRSDDMLVYISGGDHVELTGNDLSGSPMSAIFVGDGEMSRTTSASVRTASTTTATAASFTTASTAATPTASRLSTTSSNTTPPSASRRTRTATTPASPTTRWSRTDDRESSSVETAKPRVRTSVSSTTSSPGTATPACRGTGKARSGREARSIRNLLWGTAAGSIVGDGIATTRNISAAPRFVNLSGRNYGLRRGSPAIGKALIGLSPGRDLAGRARGASRDLGALEAVPNR